MDNRRVSRVVTDPVFRQVGFNPRGSEPAVNASAPIPVTTSVAANPNTTTAPDSISPVMIPPRIADPASKALPLRVPSPKGSKPPFFDDPDLKHVDSVLLSVSPTSSQFSTDRDNNSLMSSEGPDLSRSYVSRVSSGIEALNLDDCIALSKESAGTTEFSSLIVYDSMSIGSSMQPPNLPQPLNPPPPTVATAPCLPPVQEKPLKERTTKAERRAKQEADRAAKLAAKESAATKSGDVEPSTSRGGGGGKQSKGQSQKVESNLEKKPVVERATEKERKKDIPPPRMQFDDEQRVAKAKKRAIIDQVEIKNRVELFRHLPQFVHGTQLPSLEAKFFSDDSTHPHPSVYQAGLQFLTGDIIGGNARCLAMLLAFHKVIQDYCTPQERTLVRDLTTKINSYVSFLITCRPLSISMGNAIRFLKTRIARLPPNLSEEESKSQLISEIDRFIQEKIIIADKEITKHAVTKIKDGDVILTHGTSCVVEMIILHAFELGLKFRVILVDSRPMLEAKELLKRLLRRGVNCTYTHINGLSYIMQEATKVFLGASAILSNGTVYSRVGSACVAMIANSFHVPVLVCCETYKFHERVQLDSICSNELGDPDALVNVPGGHNVNELDGWAQNPNLKLLNLKYDLMPSEYVSMIISELGMVPPTSVPVILREYRKDAII